MEAAHRVTPDLFKESYPGVIGCRVVHVAQTASTMDDAARMAGEGAAEGTVVVADAQTAGRGRHRRGWISPPAKDLLFSVLLRPRPAVVSEVQVISALTVASVVERFSGAQAAIKW